MYQSFLIEAFDVSQFLGFTLSLLHLQPLLRGIICSYLRSFSAKFKRRYSTNQKGQKKPLPCFPFDF
jgi:hypothetical protein